MDLNHLYSRQQVELMRAHVAACDRSRTAHQELADIYGHRIASARRALFEAAE